jgi:hypothetical protein
MGNTRANEITRLCGNVQINIVSTITERPQIHITGAATSEVEQSERTEKTF